MKTILSFISKIIAPIAGFFAAVSFLRLSSVRYSYHLSAVFRSRPLFGASFYAIVYLICAVILFISVYKGKSMGRDGRLTGFLRIWRESDIVLLLFLTVCITFLSLYSIIDSYKSVIKILAFSTATYAAATALLSETAARLRDGTLMRTLYWKRFFDAYPLRKPVGFIFALILTVALSYLFLLCPYRTIAARLLVMRMPGLPSLFAALTGEAWSSRLNFTAYLFFMFLIAAHSYICMFILSLAEQSEAANAGKIRAERFKTELITNVSHDIRTPLTAIIGYADLLRKLPIENADFAAYTEVLQRKSSRLKTLIDDLLEASKAGTGNLSVEMQKLDLQEIVGQIAGEFDDQFAERDLTLVIRQPGSTQTHPNIRPETASGAASITTPDLTSVTAPVMASGTSSVLISEKDMPNPHEPHAQPTQPENAVRPLSINADRRHLWRVLENLFGNAAKYAMPGTRVFAEIAVRNGGIAAFTLKNTSHSPIDATGDMLAEQFIRGDRSRHADGSGLGLYIAKCLVELMGGVFAVHISGDQFEAEIIFNSRS